MHGLIIAAGFGSRLGHDKPKALIEWADGCIIDHQLANLEAAGIEHVWVVVGFRADQVREHVAKRWSNVTFVDNVDYMDNNTGKSMLCGLNEIPAGDVMALNGDVVFDAAVLPLLIDAGPGSALAVDPRACGDEEIKYRIREGRLQALSKQTHGEGEAVGINLFRQQDRPLFERALRYVDANSYYERAIEHLLPFVDTPIRCVPIGDLRAMEIDFPEDFEAAKKLFA